MKLHNTVLSLFFFNLSRVSALPSIEVSPSRRDVLERSNRSNESNIVWGPCGLNITYSEQSGGQDAFDCARLTVPLDYTSLSNGETIKLDLIRLKAINKPYKGSILYNPGGPGNSGIENVAESGERHLAVTGGHYDIIGFDPRGVGRTIPFSCNLTEPGTLTRRELESPPQTDIWDMIREEMWAEAGKTAEACYQNAYDHGRYLGTPFVARDMLSIVDALGQGPKLNYWGTSYGTILGQVFASMFPDRVGRILLDGNLVADDYLTSSWIGSNRDGEKALANLLGECVEAGPRQCSLATFAGANTTGADLMKAFYDAMSKLIGEPLPGGDNVTGDTAVFSIKLNIIDNLYRPDQYPRVVEIVEATLKSNLTEATRRPSSTGTEWSMMGENALVGIACGDSSFRTEEADDLYSIYQAHLAQSIFGDGLAYRRLNCARWRFSAVEQVDTNTLRNIRTSFPVLLVNGAYDPVTPMSDAWEVSSRLRDSRVVIHEGVGHGLNAHPSNCTDEAVRRYFTDGEMPKIGATCKPNMSAFEYLKMSSETSTDTPNEGENPGGLK